MCFCICVFVCVCACVYEHAARSALHCIVASCTRAGSPAFVVDCIDDVRTKVELLVFCHQRRIRVLSAMGAGAKVDPTRVHIGDLNDATSACAPFVAVCCAMLLLLLAAPCDVALLLSVLRRRGSAGCQGPRHAAQVRRRLRHPGMSFVGTTRGVGQRTPQ